MRDASAIFASGWLEGVLTDAAEVSICPDSFKDMNENVSVRDDVRISQTSTPAGNGPGDNRKTPLSACCLREKSRFPARLQIRMLTTPASSLLNTKLPWDMVGFESQVECLV